LSAGHICRPPHGSIDTPSLLALASSWLMAPPLVLSECSSRRARHLRVLHPRPLMLPTFLPRPTPSRLLYLHIMLRHLLLEHSASTSPSQALYARALPSTASTFPLSRDPPPHAPCAPPRTLIHRLMVCTVDFMPPKAVDGVSPRYPKGNHAVSIQRWMILLYAGP